MAIWFDVEDLIRYFQNASRPTGIQRLSFQTYRRIWQQAGASGEVRFCRRSGPRNYKAIHFPALEAGILASACVPVTPSASAPSGQPGQPQIGRVGRALRKLPLPYRLPLGVIARSTLQIGHATRDLSAALIEPLRRGPGFTKHVGGHQFELQGGDVVFGPGDWFVNLGASWDSPYDPAFIEGLRAGGTRFALLAHDLIPHLFPEWCTQAMITDFQVWMQDAVPRTDLMFANSRNTASDLVAAMRRQGEQIAEPVIVPIGAEPPVSDGAARLLQNNYVLMVGTIEVRKNHAAMVRVWRRLLETMPAGSVPDLVFAGKIGWLTADLIAQLNNAAWFGGKIRHVDSPCEAELANLYANSLFTLFPSLYEGWGLPVTESLSFGKTVAASSSSAIPEAGGSFCAYFDPDNIAEAAQVIRGLIENPAQVASLEARIAGGFRMPSWDDTARSVLAALGFEDQRVCGTSEGLQSIA
jgi:glycosyltransferase involved in cell wall biosynthesis